MPVAILARLMTRLGISIRGMAAMGTTLATTLSRRIAVFIEGLVVPLLAGAIGLILRSSLPRIHPILKRRRPFGSEHDAEIVFRVLQVIFRDNPVTAGLRIAGKGLVLFVNMSRGSADLHIGTATIERPP